MNYFSIPGFKCQTIATLTELSMHKIASQVEQEMRIPVEKMRSKRRDLEICEARHMAMFLIKKYTGASLSAIGKFFGNRDHTTVIHSIKHVNDMITT